jgi:RNA polymerase sigma-70 factor, ECF subfamily
MGMGQMLEKEFTALIDQNRGIIYKVIRLYVNHEEDEQDLFQEILFQAWRSYPKFKGNSKFSTWLYRVGLNTVLTFKRRPQVVVPHEDLSQLKVVAGENQSEITEALYIAIRELSEIDRLIITLHLDGYENEEIAEISGLTKNNVAVKLFRLKETLNKKLKAY